MHGLINGRNDKYTNRGLDEYTMKLWNKVDKYTVLGIDKTDEKIMDVIVAVLKDNIDEFRIYTYIICVIHKYMKTTRWLQR